MSANLELYTDEEDGELITQINVTPMVDIMLVLLVIFMVTATYIVKPAIEVQLPRASRAKKVTQTSMGLILKADGSLLLAGRVVEERWLFTRLQQAAKHNKEVQVILAGDAAVPHGRVVRVIDLLQRAGVTRFAINVQLDAHSLDNVSGK